MSMIAIEEEVTEATVDESAGKQAEPARREPECAETIIRPNHPINKEVSFIWTPGKRMVELYYKPGAGLGFFIREKNISFDKQCEGYTPLSWAEEYARKNMIRLPSKVEPFGTFDQLAQSVRGFIHTYFDCDEMFESVAVVYVLHTWVYESFHAVPYLRFLGDAGSGKTRGTETTGAICYRPLMIAGAATPASMYRLIEAVGGTLLLDEADFSDSEIGADVAKVLNCGYQKNLSVTRMDRNADGVFVPTLHDVFGPKILNGRKPFRDDATESRCLTYRPSTTGRTDIPVQLPKDFEQQACAIRNQALAWRFAVLDKFIARNERIEGLSPRANQIILPLLSVVDCMGVDLRERYREDLLAFARLRDHQATEDRRGTVEAKLIDAFVNTIWQQPPTCQDLTELAISRSDAEDPKLKTWLTPRESVPHSQ